MKKSERVSLEEKLKEAKWLEDVQRQHVRDYADMLAKTNETIKQELTNALCHFRTTHEWVAWASRWLDKVAKP